MCSQKWTQFCFVFSTKNAHESISYTSYNLKIIHKKFTQMLAKQLKAEYDISFCVNNSLIVCNFTG